MNDKWYLLVTDDITTNLIEDVKLVVKDWLKEGRKPSEISYALSYVATDLGLFVTDRDVSVFPVLLSAISEAVSSHDSNDDTNELEPEADTDAAVPVEATIH